MTQLGIDPVTLGRPLPTKIAIVGFADSRDEAPYSDPSWEIWGVNDVYAHVPRVDRSFELHDTSQLVNEGRRNPQYEAWLREGKIPVYSFNPKPQYPSQIAFPIDQVTAAFGDYFTNSIAWMTALALLVLCEQKDGQIRARPGVELGLWGVDMAHETEYGAQRPSCEYYIGLARALGISVFIPPTSDLLKAGSLYGISTTVPMRIKLDKRIVKMKEQLNVLNAARQQKQMEIAHIEAQMNQIKGGIGAFQYTRGVWTNGTEVVPEAPGDKQRIITPPSDGQVSLVDPNGEISVAHFMSQLDAQETKNG